MIPLNQKAWIIFSDMGQDEWGIPNDTDHKFEYKVRLDFNSQADLVQTGDGREIIYNATMYFKGAVPVKYTDFIEYDSGIEGIVKRNPQVIFPITDLRGKVTYTKVLI